MRGAGRNGKLKWMSACKYKTSTIMYGICKSECLNECALIEPKSDTIATHIINLKNKCIHLKALKRNHLEHNEPPSLKNRKMNFTPKVS